MIVGGTFFSHAVQSMGLKLLFLTLVVWLAKDGFERYILKGKRGLRLTAVWAVLAVLAVIGAWVAMYAYQGPGTPERPYQLLHDKLCDCKTGK